MTPPPYAVPGPKRIAAALKLIDFPAQHLVEMVAVHGAETSGDVWAVGLPNKNGSRDYGAWQINSNEPNGPHNWASYFQNAKYAYAIWKLQGFGAWYAYPKIDNVAGFGGSNLTWRQWAQKGVNTMNDHHTRLGYTYERIASLYLPLDGTT